MNGWLTSMPRHSLTRCLNRRLGYSLTRRCAGRTVRRVGRGTLVNYLAQALTAFNRAVRPLPTRAARSGDLRQRRGQSARGGT